MLKKKDVEHVAKLAQLDLNDDEKGMFTKQLEDIINLVDKLKELNTEGIEPTSSVVPLKNVVRMDEAKESFSQDEALYNAPDKEIGHFKIPRIME